jgi:hypothetical protein
VTGTTLDVVKIAHRRGIRYSWRVTRKRRNSQYPVEHSAIEEKQPEGHRYEVRFAEVPDSARIVAIAAAFERALAKCALISADGCEPWCWSGDVAIAHLAEGPSAGADGFRAFFVEVERVLAAVDAAATVDRVRSTERIDGDVDETFEAARRDARDELKPHAEKRGGCRLVPADRDAPGRPTLPASLATRFAMVVSSARAADGTWWVLAPESNQPGGGIVMCVIEPGAPERQSEPLRWGKSPVPALSPDGRHAIVPSVHPDATPGVGRWRPFLYEVERARLGVTPLGEIDDVGPSGSCALAWLTRERLAIVTEGWVRLVERAGLRTVARLRCTGGRAIAATADGRFFLVGCADGRTRTRVYQARGDTLALLAERPEQGTPWASGARLFLSDAERQWEVAGLP